MDIASVKQTLCGPMIPELTSFDSQLAVDHGAIRANVETTIERGIVNGRGVLLAAGAGGDFPMLTLEERKAVSRTIVEAADGRAPVLVGVQGTHPDEIIAMARCAEELGAYGVQFGPGYYYQSSDEDCLRLFGAVHEATERIAIMIYNTHWEGYDMSLDQLERLLELPRCVSIKWSSPDAGTYLRGVDRFAERASMVDNQGLAVMSHMLGGTGFITHLATVWPEYDLGTWDLLEDGDYVGAQARIIAANWPWQSFRGKMWKRTGAESPVVKAALELCGRPGGPTRLPSRELTSGEKAELREILVRIGVPDVV